MSEVMKENAEINATASNVTEPATAATTPDDELKALLVKYGVKDTDAALQKLQEFGVETVEDLKALSDQELCQAGFSLVKARNLLKELNNAPAPAEHATAAPIATTGIGRAIMPMFGMANLPEVPSEEAWLSGLKVDGILKCNQGTYISAVRASIADSMDVRQLPKRLCEMMKEYAEENDEPVPELYWELRKQAKQRDYADIFAAIGGESNVTDADRKTLVNRMKQLVWPAAGNCYIQLQGWAKILNSCYNPLVVAVENVYGGNAVTPSMGTIPDVAPIRDSADDLRNAINRALSGVGPTAAAAMACDYTRAKKTLSDPRLPAYVGVSGKEQLFKKLGIDVGSSLIRTENDLVQFILGMVLSDERASADNEVAYFFTLHNLGARINWGGLGISVGNNNTGGNAHTAHFEGITGNQL